MAEPNVFLNAQHAGHFGRLICCPLTPRQRLGSPCPGGPAQQQAHNAPHELLHSWNLILHLSLMADESVERSWK